ncbi:hypothetical protein BD769DRAFT_1675204 [Suillus cothurnatus]|nr:hypothetical protein BD769DRAFT_1675204 [Suillus cothurnatus]
MSDDEQCAFISKHQLRCGDRVCIVSETSALYDDRAEFNCIANLIENDPATFYELKCNLSEQGIFPFCILMFSRRIGFDHYQWQLFVITGLGWLADNLWLQGLAIVLPQVQQELDPVWVEYAVLAEFAGLTVGASTWGIMADLIRRRLSFNITLSRRPLWIGSSRCIEFCSLIACMGFGVGGNLPVDGALYLEHIPQSHQTLALLSVWWALGQSLISWGFIANFSCNPSIPDGQCPKSANMGWWYTLYILIVAGLSQMFLQVLEHIARRNGRTITLELEDLQAIFGDTTSKPAPSLPTNVRNAFSGMFLYIVCFNMISAAESSAARMSVRSFLTGAWQLIQPLSSLSGGILIGIAYPLFNAYLMPTSNFIFRHKECGMYGVLYAYTPEVPAPHRGTGDALCSGLNRIGRFITPLIKIATTPLDGSTSANMENGPVFVSAMLFMVTAILTMLLPIETVGNMAL